MNATSDPFYCVFWSSYKVNTALYDSKSFGSIRKTVAVINFLSSPVSAIGNGLVLMAIITTPSLHTPDNILIGSLALADFLIGIVAQPMLMALVIKRDLFLDCVFMDSFTYIGAVCTSASVTLMAAVSGERCMALFLPMRYPTLVTNRRAFIVASVICIFWLAVTWLFLVSNILFQIIFGIAWFTSSCIIGFSYAKILRLVRHHRRQIQSQQAAVSTNTDTASQTKLAITMGYVIGVSLLCYIPAASVCEVYLTIKSPSTTMFNTVFLTTAVQFTSSSFIPVMYCWRRQDIRQPIIAVLQRVFSPLKN